MTIIIFGGAGFIGRYLKERLLTLGHDVVVVDLNGIPSIDICDKRRINDIFKSIKPDLVFHLAANTNVPLSVEDPLFDFRSLEGSMNIISQGVPIVYVSSGFVYGNTKNRPTKETEPFQVTAPYGIVKHTVESYLKFYGDVKNLPYVIVRPATVYGPRQVKGAMADYFNKLESGEQAVIYGEKTRDYLYVEDLIDALILLMDKLDGGIYNVGTGVETSLTDLYSKIAKLLGKEDKPIRGYPRHGELNFYSLDSSKLRALGWKSKYNLDKGLKLCLKERKQKTTHLD